MKYKYKYLQEKDAKEYAQQSFENIRKQNVELLEQIERLQEQLKEANKVLSGMVTPQTPSIEPVIKYLEKWGVK